MDTGVTKFLSSSFRVPGHFEAILVNCSCGPVVSVHDPVVFYSINLFEKRGRTTATAVLQTYSI